ncbi:MAG: FliH/SctL family protein [Halioglobus sp.]|nr:FliH/SctL family protein [Halioglobus sp.]
MSDPGGPVELWTAPFFEQPADSQSQGDPAERESMAQALGFQSGREEGFAAGKAEAENIVASLMSVADQMARPYRQLDEVVTRELARMAMLLAEQIVRRELSLDTRIIEGLVEEALSTLYKLEGEIVIFLNPADAQLVQEFSPESLEGKDWKIVEDPNLHPGGCQVKTPTSFVDASVEKRIETVFASLVESCEPRLDN